MIRRAKAPDLDSIMEIYNMIFKQEEEGLVSVGWVRGVYPTRKTILDALGRNDLFVYEDEGKILAVAIINQIQDKTYEKANWDYKVPADRVCVLHTLAVSPKFKGRGIGKEFIKFYEKYARENGWYELRMDTNEKNLKARSLYKSLSYKEIEIVATVFNGIPGVNLVLLEKNLKG
jgi:GNAT superfamily N-acetyltransferase